MGLSPKWLENCDEDVLQVYQDAEDAILANMAERIAAFDCYIPAAEYQRQVLLEMGATQEYILKELSRRTGIAKEKLKQLMQEAGIEAAQSDAEIHRANGKPVPDQASDVMQSILQAGYEQTAGAFDNMTRTTALTGTNQLYRELNTAWLTVSSGAMSYDQAVRVAIKSLAASGLDAAVYPSGRTMSIDSVVRMAVRTGVNQTAAHVQIQLAEELGADLVEVTAHAGARPSHAAWQGKVYSLSGNTPGYETLEAATGYGTVSGLCGANCRHNFFPYYEGDARAHTQDELQEYTKLDAVTYNGKGYSLYEAQQIQRAHERQIRKWKRERDMLKTVGKDNSEAIAKLRYWKERQADFLEQTGLRRQASREQVYARAGLKEHESSKRKYRYAETVASDKINSPAYRRKFNEFNENKKVIRKMWEESKKAIKHRSGTKYEDMIFVHSQTGEVCAQTQYEIESQVMPTRKMKGMINDSEPFTVIAIHNHPGSGVPSIADLRSSFEHKYKYGVIACHNGTLMQYRVTKEFNDVEVDFWLDMIERKLYNDTKDMKLIDRYIDKLKQLGVELKVI